MTTLLMVLIVLAGNAPVKHATVACDGLYVYWREDATGGEGVMETDSRGAVIILTEPTTWRCCAWKVGLGQWCGTLTVDRTRTKFTAHLKPLARTPRR